MNDVFGCAWWNMTPLEVRESINQRIMQIEATVPSVRSVEERIIKNESRTTPIRIYLPNQDKNLPVILLIHGGAWVAGNLDTHDNLARYLCSQVEAMVISVEYTNAPEGKFPLQLQQCTDVLTWVVDHGTEFSADASRIAIVGDSAGGNMAAALCLIARDQQGPKIDLQVLINPALDLRCNGTFERQNDALDMLRWQASQYLSNPHETNNPYVSPLCSNSLSNLPDTVILLAEKDELRPDGEKYAAKLRGFEVPTIVYCQLGIGHLAGHGAKASNVAQESLEVAVYAIKRAFFKDEKDHKRMVEKFNNRFYNESGQSFDKIPFEDTLPELLLKHQIRGEVLEIGSGAGALAAWLVEQGCKVTCIEPAQELARKVLERGIKVYSKTIQEFYPEQQYDHVVAISSLIHVPKEALPDQIQKISRLLKPDGKLFVSFIEGEEEGFEDPTQTVKMRYFAKWTSNELDTLFSSQFVLLEDHKIYNKKMDRTFILRTYVMH